MSPELFQWISSAVIVGLMLYLHRVTRQDIKELRGDISDFRVHVDTENGNLRNRMDTGFGNLRNRMDTGFGNLRNRMGRLEERMARLEGTLDVLREFFVRNRRGTAA